MRVMLGACVVGLLLLGPACRAEAQKANALRLGRSVFHEPQIAATKSLPPQFEIVWTYEAPTPGYEFSIDSVDVDASTGRIRVRITETRPSGMVAQVITPTRVRVPLGELERGPYFLELWMRRGDAAYRPLQSLLLTAS